MDFGHDGSWSPASGDCYLGGTGDVPVAAQFAPIHRRLSQTLQAIKDLDVVLHREPHNKEAQEHRRW